MQVECKLALNWTDQGGVKYIHMRTQKGADETCLTDRKLSIKNDLWKPRLFWSQTYSNVSLMSGVSYETQISSLSL